MELEGSVVVVTGGSRGIGRGIAESFAAEGARIVIADLLGIDSVRSACDDAIRAVERMGTEACAVEVDVRDGAACESLIAATLDRFGQLDVVCANAGVLSLQPIEDIEPQEWDRIFAVNAKGVFLTCKAAVPYFKQRRSGCFVNTASITAKRATAGAAAYSASKFAVLGFTQALAFELAPFGVRANALCPGYLATNMWLNDILGAQAAGRDPKPLFDKFVRREQPLPVETVPADIGQAAVYLAKADSVTGVGLNVAGGVEVF